MAEDSNKEIVLKFKKLHPEAQAPTRGSTSASGLDLRALEYKLILPGQTVLVKTGIAFQIPKGYEIQVRARSGLSLKTGLRLANGIGTVDQDYTGDCSVLMHNTSDQPYEMLQGERIAQAVLCPVILAETEEVQEFDEVTERGDSGFGSTGKS